MSYTHMLHIHIVHVSAEAIDFNILLCQYIKAYVYIVHTYVTHIIRRQDYTCLNMKPETRACIQGLCKRSDNATGSEIVINPTS